MFIDMRDLAELGQTPTAGPNRQGGLPTRFGPQYVFNPDRPDVIYSVPIVVGLPSILANAGYILPSQAGLPAAAATFVWDNKKGQAPWPGMVDPGMPTGTTPAAFANLPLRAGPNLQGGKPTKFGPQYVFNEDEPNIIYSVPMVVGLPSILANAGYVLPSQAGMKAAPATFVWDPKKGPAPYPGVDTSSGVVAPTPLMPGPAPYVPSGYTPGPGGTIVPVGAPEIRGTQPGAAPYSGAQDRVSSGVIRPVVPASPGLGSINLPIVGSVPTIAVVGFVGLAGLIGIVVVARAKKAQRRQGEALRPQILAPAQAQTQAPTNP